MESISQDSLRITVPDELKSILKEYTKNILRAQPDDLIKWSAHYFRSLVNIQISRLENKNEEKEIEISRLGNKNEDEEIEISRLQNKNEDEEIQIPRLENKNEDEENDA